MGKNIMKETKSELKKVIWPTKKQVINSTGVVIAMVLIMGAVIFAFDFVSGLAVKSIINSNIGVSENNVIEEHDHEHENVEDNIENNTTDDTVDTNVTGEANQ